MDPDFRSQYKLLIPRERKQTKQTTHHWKLQVSSLTPPLMVNTKNEQSSFFLRLIVKHCHMLSEGSGVQLCVFKKVLSWVQMDSCINLSFFFPSSKKFPTAEPQHSKRNLLLHLSYEKPTCFHTTVTESSQVEVISPRMALNWKGTWKATLFFFFFLMSLMYMLFLFGA